MGLKLRVSTGDDVVMSGGIIITVLASHKDGSVTLEVDAPKEVKVHTIFADPTKQFKNLRNRSGNK